MTDELQPAEPEGVGGLLILTAEAEVIPGDPDPVEEEAEEEQ